MSPQSLRVRVYNTGVDSWGLGFIVLRKGCVCVLFFFAGGFGSVLRYFEVYGGH